MNPRNILLPLLSLIIFVFLSAVGIIILDGVLTGFESSVIYSDNMANVIKFFRASYYWWDYISLFLSVVFIIGTAITSYKLRSHPIGYLLAFILVPLYGFISYFFNYLFIQMFSPSAMQAVQSYFPISIVICTNLHWLAIIMTITGAILAYSYHTDGGQEQGGGDYLT